MVWTRELEQHRRALRYHCYQMLGSLSDAEDMTQETIARALVAKERFEGRSEIRTWLFRIATHACIDEIRRRKRRKLISTTKPNGAEPGRDEEFDLDLWIQPFPDALVPAEQLARIEAVTLAFVAALQWLPPRQRAVLVLRDTLGWSAEDVADLLGMTAAAVHSALSRAHKTIESRPRGRAHGVDDVAAARRLAIAFERRDVKALTAMLRDDIVVHMPPMRLWLRGRDAMLEFTMRRVLADRDMAVTVTRANRRLALTLVDRAGNAPFAINVIELDRKRRLAEMYAFVIPSIVPWFQP